jgi:hypothetical protein
MEKLAPILVRILAWLALAFGGLLLLFSLTPGTDMVDAPILFETAWCFIVPALLALVIVRILRRRGSRS